MVRHQKKRLTLLDGILLLCFAIAGYYLYVRIKVGVHYDWSWETIPQYLFRFDADRGRWVPNLLVEGLLTTIRLSIWATILATVIGALVGLLRVSGRLYRRLVGGTYVELIRNLPPLVLVFLFYYFLGDQVLPVLHLRDAATNLPQGIQSVLGMLVAPPETIVAFLSAVITLALFEGAYIAEIIRAGIQSIERGQWEAADALGFSGWQKMRHIVLPQAVQRILPPLAGQFISTIKDSAIVSVISIQELTFQGMELMAATYLTFEVWITITLMYLALTLSCSLLLENVRLRLGTYASS